MVILKEPTSVKEALQDEGCTQAMKNEIAVLEKNQTYTLVPKQEGMNIIGVKWVFKVKYEANNTFDKLKACLVAKGDKQEEGANYSDTFCSCN